MLLRTVGMVWLGAIANVRIQILDKLWDWA